MSVLSLLDSGVFTEETEETEERAKAVRAAPGA
jgi:hypothetical protein